MRFFFLLIVCITTSAIYGQKYNSEIIKDINYTVINPKHYDYYCSDEANYGTRHFKTFLKSTCSELPYKEGTIFQFTSKSQEVSFMLKFGKWFGTIRMPHLLLLDENFKTINCWKAESIEQLFLSMQKEGLTIDKNYYLAICPDPKNGVSGDFNYCFDNLGQYTPSKIALPIDNTKMWCSGDNMYDTKGAKPSFPGSSCLNGTSNHNAWFKITAKTPFISIQINAHKSSEKFLQPVITLYDEHLHEIKCEDQKTGQNFKLTCSSLIMGKSYYFSIDQKDYKEHMGKYGFCIDNKPLESEETFFSIKGQAFRMDGPVVSNKTILLVHGKSGEIVLETTTDNNGNFSFHYLPPKMVNDLELKFTEKDAAIDIEAFILDENLNITKTSFVNSSGNVSFDNSENNKLDGLKLFSKTNIPSMNIEKGKRGITGKMVQESDNTKGLVGESVYLLNHQKIAIDSAYTKANGSFQFNNLPPDQFYMVNFFNEDEGYYVEMLYLTEESQPIMAGNSDDMDENGAFHFHKLPFIEDASFEEFKLMDNTSLNLSGLEAGVAVKLDNLFFKPNSAELMANSKMGLEELLKALNEDPFIQIEIIGHTDNIGLASTNLDLSKDRARSVGQYLIDQGIKPTRLVFKGYGMQKPIASNDTPQGRSMNRRVEIKIIE